LVAGVLESLNTSEFMLLFQVLLRYHCWFPIPNDARLEKLALGVILERTRLLREDNMSGLITLTALQLLLLKHKTLWFLRVDQL
jgi:hypothetical protein